MDPVNRFLVIFPSIVFEAMPFIILGALVSGALEELLPQRLVTRLIPKNRHLAVAASALLGLIFPMCECGIVPVMRRLLGKGLPLSCAVAYMLAAPIINPIVIASTWAAFSGDRTGLDGLTSYQMVGWRVGLGFLTAFIVGLVVYRLTKGGKELIKPLVSAPAHEHHHEHDHHHGEHQSEATGSEESHDHSHSHEHDDHSHGHEHAHSHEHGHVHDAAAAPELEKKTLFQRLSSISETALHDFVDIACFLILGAFLASIVQTVRLMDYMPVGENDFLAVPIMMFMAVLLCLCSEADAFVAANINPLPMGGKLAFLVMGPMMDIKLFFMYTRVFKFRLIWTIIAAVTVCVFILCLAAPYVDMQIQEAFQSVQAQVEESAQ